MWLGVLGASASQIVLYLYVKMAFPVVCECVSGEEKEAFVESEIALFPENVSNSVGFLLQNIFLQPVPCFHQATGSAAGHYIVHIHIGNRISYGIYDIPFAWGNCIRNLSLLIFRLEGSGYL